MIVAACGGSPQVAAPRDDRGEAPPCPTPTTPQIDQFVTLWSAKLLDPAFQRALISSPDLPNAPEVPGVQEAPEQEQRVLASCLAERMAQLRDQGLGQNPKVEVRGGENVYEGSFVSSTGTPYHADILYSLIFNRDNVDFLEDAEGIPVQPQPQPGGQDPGSLLDQDIPSPSP